MDPQMMAQLQMYQQLFGNRGQEHPALHPAAPPAMAPNGVASGLGTALAGNGTMPGLATALLMRRKQPPTPVPPQGAPSPDGGGDGGSADPNTP